MDRRSWLWRRKSSEKSPGEAESCGSMSSHSERYSDDQEVSKASPIHAQSPEVSSNVASSEHSDTIKSLTEKLTSALSTIRAKEDLVNQHAKVAEEAVSGWEKAERELISLRQQLETALQKNSTLEERISQLDGALKECVKQFQQSREEQEQRVQNALVRKTREWESEKFELESRLVELEVQLEAAKEVPASVSHDLQSRLEEIGKENAILRSGLLAQSKELNIRTMERDLSNHAAETASKQHLESIKKVTKLEAECRVLQTMARKSSGYHKPDVNSVFVESCGQSDSGERLLQLDRKPSGSDLWASALIAELDQFKSGKAAGQNSTATSVDIDLMDDFVEMEKLVAWPEPEHGSPFIDPQDNPSTGDIRSSSMEAELKALHERVSELEKNENRMETEKTEMERLLAETQDHLEGTRKQLKETETKLVNLRRQLQFADDSKHAAEIAIATAEVQRKLLESQLQSADLEVQELHEKVGSLERKIEEERVLSTEQARKCQNLENELLKRKREAEIRRAVISNGESKIKQEKELAGAAKKFAECQKTIASIGQQLKSLATLDDFMCEGEKTQLTGGSPQISESQKIRKMCMNDTSESTSGTSSLLNKMDLHSPPLSSPSSSTYFQDMQNLSLKVGSIVV